MQARGDQMIWLKREEQLQLGLAALVRVMDALLDLQAGTAAPKLRLHSQHAVVTHSLHYILDCPMYGFLALHMYTQQTDVGPMCTCHPVPSIQHNNLAAVLVMPHLSLSYRQPYHVL